jgi:hypothetical protein
MGSIGTGGAGAVERLERIRAYSPSRVLLTPPSRPPTIGSVVGVVGVVVVGVVVEVVDELGAAQPTLIVPTVRPRPVLQPRVTDTGAGAVPEVDGRTLAVMELPDWVTDATGPSDTMVLGAVVPPGGVVVPPPGVVVVPPGVVVPPAGGLVPPPEGVVRVVLGVLWVPPEGAAPVLPVVAAVVVAPEAAAVKLVLRAPAAL